MLVYLNIALVGFKCFFINNINNDELLLFSVVLSVHEYFLFLSYNISEVTWVMLNLNAYLKCWLPPAANISKVHTGGLPIPLSSPYCHFRANNKWEISNFSMLLLCNPRKAFLVGK